MQQTPSRPLPPEYSITLDTFYPLGTASRPLPLDYNITLAALAVPPEYKILLAALYLPGTTYP